jgi:hypothetical protein
LVIAASHAPVPDPGNRKTVPLSVRRRCRFGAQHALQPGEKRQRERTEIGRAHVLLRDVHGAPDGLGHVGGSRDEKMGLSGSHWWASRAAI